MEKAILLAVAASFCTATASVCQRLGARRHEMAGFDVGLVFRLARQPAWLLGMASMIPGFVVQISAPRFAFGYMTVIGRRVKVTGSSPSSPTGRPTRSSSPERCCYITKYRIANNSGRRVTQVSSHVTLRILYRSSSRAHTLLNGRGAAIQRPAGLEIWALLATNQVLCRAMVTPVEAVMAQGLDAQVRGAGEVTDGQVASSMKPPLGHLRCHVFDDCPGCDSG